MHFTIIREHMCICLNTLYLCNDETSPFTVKLIPIKLRLCVFFFFFGSDNEFVNSIFGISFIKLHCFV